MTLEKAIEMEQSKARIYEADSRFLGTYGFYERSREKKQMAEDHKEYVEWFRQLLRCKEEYKRCLKILDKKVVTAEDSAENKKAYAVVQTFKEILG